MSSIPGPGLCCVLEQDTLFPVALVHSAVEISCDITGAKMYQLLPWITFAVWSGVEWSGMEWSGMAWSGIEWHGVEWGGVE